MERKNLLECLDKLREEYLETHDRLLTIEECIEITNEAREAIKNEKVGDV